VLDMGDGLNSVPKFWGVATLETNFSTLEQFGIFLSAKGTLQINTTQQTKVETITLPASGRTAAMQHARSRCGRSRSRCR